MKMITEVNGIIDNPYFSPGRPGGPVSIDPIISCVMVWFNVDPNSDLADNGGMNEYIVTTSLPTPSPRYVSLSKGKILWASFTFATVFKVRERAEKVAKKCGGRVIPHYGKDVSSTKRTVAPVQSKINRHSAYRSI